MPRPRVSDVARRLTADIDPNSSVDASVLDGHINKVLGAATEALKSTPTGYSDFAIGNLSQMYEGMRHSHATIRLLLQRGWNDPSCVDALAIARLQIETLYSLCLLLEQPKYESIFIKNGWKKLYIRFLLQREECADLPRFREFLEKQAHPPLEGMRRQAGVTDAERCTIEHDELGTPLPTGVSRVTIGSFPLPSKVIGHIKASDCRSMLERLYPEYEYLCNFTHSTLEGWVVRTMLYGRSPYRRFLETSSGDRIEEVFRKQVGEPAMLYSFVSIAQACAELTRLYPSDYELLAKTVEAWAWLIEDSLLGRSIWERRTKSLLKALR